MNKLNELASVLLIFTFGFFVIFFFIWLANKIRIFNLWSLCVVSLGAGLGFGIIGFLFTYLDEKSQTWTLLERLSVGTEIFIWSFVGSFIVLPLSKTILKLKGRLMKN